jgi:tetratricopeptide (TPR) repeat protein
MWVSDSYEYIYALAESNLARGDYETALANFERLSERLSQLKPVVLERRPELRNLLLVSLGKQAEIHHIQGEYEEAVEFYQQAIDIAPETRDRWQRDLALVRIDMGQAEEGLDELRAQAIATPGDSELWLTIGVECEGLGRLDEAEENLERAARVATDPEDKTETYLALFDFYRAQGQVEEAMAAWEHAWEDGQESDYVFPVYQMMWEVGDLERAREYLRREKNPLRKGFHQGLMAASDGEDDEAAKHWKRVAKMNPLEYDEGHEAWAEAALRVDHPPEEIIAALAAVLETGDFTSRGLSLQAIAEARIGHVEHAQDVLEMARNIGMRTRPREEKLSPAHWAMFDELVTDDEIKEQLQPYFQSAPEEEVEATQEELAE